MYERLFDFCVNYISFWNANEELEDIGEYNKELRRLIDESVDDIEATIKEIRKEYAG